MFLVSLCTCALLSLMSGMFSLCCLAGDEADVTLSYRRSLFKYLVNDDDLTDDEDDRDV